MAKKTKPAKAKNPKKAASEAQGRREAGREAQG